MKATFFTTLLILLSATITISHLPSATADYVLDSNGNPLQLGQDYYITSVSWGAGAGGVTYPNTDNETCPTTVILSGDDYDPGSPMKFSSPMRARNIYEGLNLGFSFSSPPAGCASSWTVVDGGGGEFSINLGGVSGGEKYSSSSRVVSGWFSIESSRRYYDSYRLVFCIEGRRSCLDVGVRVDQNGVQSLFVVTDSRSQRGKKNSFLVQFKRPRRHHHHHHHDASLLSTYADDA